MNNAVLEPSELVPTKSELHLEAQKAFTNNLTTYSQFEKTARAVVKSCIAQHSPVQIQTIRDAFGDEVTCLALSALLRAEKSGLIEIVRDAKLQQFTTSFNLEFVQTKFMTAKQ
ncbi:MAG: hypothetical protein JNJ85_04725 [Candidatus Kapabacteria bacterium]|nr:hypothetical protein [Candidatus Kapabacteria bacterium]MBX7156084.1 hypothetical protein [Bacteroidota bacterium]